MRNANVLAGVALIAFAGGWVLPVVDGRPGWEAFRVALSPLWPYEGFGFDAWYDAALTIASGLTNVVFALEFVDVVVARRASVRVLAAVLLAALAIDLHWLVRAGAQFTQLQVGYYAWLAAFPLLALAALAARR
jgi:hypothetical protein